MLFRTFYDHDMQYTPVVTGPTAVFDCSALYKVKLDDAMLDYLSENALQVTIKHKGGLLLTSRILIYLMTLYYLFVTVLYHKASLIIKLLLQNGRPFLHVHCHKIHHSLECDWPLSV